MLKGECIQCGDCCLYGDAIKYLVYEKGNIKVYVFDKVNKKKKRKIAPCEHLYYDIETRKAKCNIYLHRPALCKQFPYVKEELIFKNCGFKK